MHVQHLVNGHAYTRITIKNPAQNDIFSLSLCFGRENTKLHCEMIVHLSDKKNRHFQIIDKNRIINFNVCFFGCIFGKKKKEKKINYGKDLKKKPHTRSHISKIETILKIKIKLI